MRCLSSFRLWCLGAVAVLALPVGVSAQAPAQSPFRVAQQCFIAADGRIDYVAPVQALLASKAAFDPSAYQQAMATYHSFIGKGAPYSPVPAPSMAYALAKADSLLLAGARGTSVVIINEAHDHPAHRAYCARVLQQLAPLGYRTFAVEALEPTDTAINSRKYPIAASGFYTCEPNMGQLLRVAGASGYYIFGHEIREAQEKEFTDIEKRINYRDSIQAVNVLAVLRKNPSAKIVALVGYDHLLEKERDGVKRLATYLRELGGPNPFTVDQTLELAPAGGSPSALPRALTSTGSQPLTWGDNRGYVDLQVVHPHTAMQQGRPAWLGTYGGRVPVIAAIPPAQMGKACLVQLYDQREYQQHGEKAIPLDQYLLDAQQKQVRLYKQTGQHNVVIRYKPAKL